jgi:hypothetical protein
LKQKSQLNTYEGELVDSGALILIAVPSPVGPNVVCGKIKKTCPVQLEALLSLAQHRTETILE